MKLSFGIVFAVVAVLGCSAVSIPAGPVSDASLRKLKASQETGLVRHVPEPPPIPVVDPECAYFSQDFCEPISPPS